MGCHAEISWIFTFKRELESVHECSADPLRLTFGKFAVAQIKFVILFIIIAKKGELLTSLHIRI